MTTEIKPNEAEGLKQLLKDLKVKTKQDHSYLGVTKSHIGTVDSIDLGCNMIYVSFDGVKGSKGFCFDEVEKLNP